MKSKELDVDQIGEQTNLSESDEKLISTYIQKAKLKERPSGRQTKPVTRKNAT